MVSPNQMTGNNEHYIPQWYQRNFSLRSGFVNCVRFDEYGITCGERPIRRTCSGQYYYGSNSSIDTILSPLENTQAPIFSDIADTGNLPSEYSHEHLWIVISLAVFLTRTEAAIKEYQDQFNQAQQFNGLPGNGLSHDEIIERSVVMYPVISDLKMVLLSSSQNLNFISSDSPVLRLNPLMFNTSIEPHVGLASKGIVIVFPLNSRCCLVLFDSESYTLDSNAVAVTASAIENLNLLQTLAAHEFIFYRDGDGQIEKNRLEVNSELKNKGEHRTNVYAEGSTYMYSRISDVIPKLDFLKIRDGAKKERAKHLRWVTRNQVDKQFSRSKSAPLIRHSEALQQLVDAGKLRLSDLNQYLC